MCFEFKAILCKLKKCKEMYFFEKNTYRPNNNGGIVCKLVYFFSNRETLSLMALDMYAKFLVRLVWLHGPDNHIFNCSITRTTTNSTVTLFDTHYYFEQNEHQNKQLSYANSPEWKRRVLNPELKFLMKEQLNFVIFLFSTSTPLSSIRQWDSVNTYR